MLCGRYDEKRETGGPGDMAFCIFAVERIYVQFLAPWDANELVCEAVSTKSVPEIVAILPTEGDAALKKLGFEAPEVSPNYSQLMGDRSEERPASAALQPPWQ
jgi:hypothetical protein